MKRKKKQLAKMIKSAFDQAITLKLKHGECAAREYWKAKLETLYLDWLKSDITVEQQVLKTTRCHVDFLMNLLDKTEDGYLFHLMETILAPSYTLDFSSKVRSWDRSYQDRMDQGSSLQPLEDMISKEVKKVNGNIWKFEIGSLNASVYNKFLRLLHSQLSESVRLELSLFFFDHISIGMPDGFGPT